jgi:hypothetical protein
MQLMFEVGLVQRLSNLRVHTKGHQYQDIAIGLVLQKTERRETDGQSMRRV